MSLKAGIVAGNVAGGTAIDARLAELGDDCLLDARAALVEGTLFRVSFRQTARLLEAASANVLPYVAVGAFAGLRRAELERAGQLDAVAQLLERGLRGAEFHHRRDRWAASAT